MVFNRSYLSKVTCDAPQHCCENVDQGCKGRCIPESYINDGGQDCDDGSDEKGTCSFLCNIRSEWQPYYGGSITQRRS